MRTAGGRRQEAGGRRQEAGGRRQEAGGRRQEAGGRRQVIANFYDDTCIPTRPRYTRVFVGTTPYAALFEELGKRQRVHPSDETEEELID
jgi:hypothetical protein